MNGRAIFNLCWLLGHHEEQVIDRDARQVYQKCGNCGRKRQFDFQADVSPEWIGFCDGEHRCPLCWGWKPKDWDRCSNEICAMNPKGKLYLSTDGKRLEPRLDE